MIEKNSGYGHLSMALTTQDFLVALATVDSYVLDPVQRAVTTVQIAKHGF
jgi:hypothetical protein